AHHSKNSRQVLARPFAAGPLFWNVHVPRCIDHVIPCDFDRYPWFALRKSVVARVLEYESPVRAGWFLAGHGRYFLERCRIRQSRKSDGSRFAFCEAFAGPRFRKFVIHPKYIPGPVEVDLVLFCAFCNVALELREAHEPTRRRDVQAKELLIALSTGRLPYESIHFPR